MPTMQINFDIKGNVCGGRCGRITQCEQSRNPKTVDVDLLHMSVMEKYNSISPIKRHKSETLAFIDMI